MFQVSAGFHHLIAIMNMPISRLCNSFYLTNLQIVLPITYHCISKNVYLICCFKTVAVEVVRQLTNIEEPTNTQIITATVKVHVSLGKDLIWKTVALTQMIMR